MEWTRGQYRITDNRNEADIDFIVESLHSTYWAEERPREVLETSIANSVMILMFDGTKPIGFARIVADNCTFAWICDVFVHPDYRGRRLGVWLMECTQAHPTCKVRINMLATGDAHTLYEKFGYVRQEAMVKRNPHIVD